MFQRIIGMMLAVVLVVGLCGCARDPFAYCDRRKSLADWFDMYGPTGCYSCDGNCDCADGNCR